MSKVKPNFQSKDIKVELKAVTVPIPPKIVMISFSEDMARSLRDYLREVWRENSHRDVCYVVFDALDNALGENR